MPGRIFHYVTAVIILTAILFTPCTAQARNGYIQADLARSSIDDQIDADGLILDLDESTSAYRVAFGYEWNDYLSFEAAWNDLGTVSADFQVTTVEAEADGFDLDLVLRWPVSESFSLTGRVGYLFWDAQTRAAQLQSNDSGEDLFFGVGAEYHTSDRLAVTLGWNRYRLDNIDVEHASLGLRLRFGTQD